MRILLIDNMDPVALERLAESIRAKGYEVDTAGTPQKALELAANPDKHYDLIISDLDMAPNANGIELMEQIRQIPNYKDTPAALHTSAPEDHAFKDGVEKRLNLMYCPKITFGSLENWLADYDKNTKGKG